MSTFSHAFYTPSYCPYDRICAEKAFSSSVGYWEGLLKECSTPESDAIRQCMADAAKGPGWGRMGLFAAAMGPVLVGIGLFASLLYYFYK
jgi:hypothetical protein